MRRAGLLLLALAACKPRPAPPTPPGWEWLNPRVQGNTLRAVYTNDHNVYAVGEAGTILASTDGGATFAAQPSGTSATLTGVTGDRGGLVAVGEHGTILASTNGHDWTRMVSPTGEDLEAVWANGHGRHFAVGAHGLVLRSTDGGAAWEPLLSGTTVTLRGVYGAFRVDDVYAVGDGGTIIAVDGDSPRWTKRDSGTDEDLHAVWVNRRGHVIVAVGGGVIVRSIDKGASFHSGPAPRPSLLGIDGDEHAIWTCGTGGALFVSANSGETFAPAASQVAETLFAVATTDEGVILGGTFGAVSISGDHGHSFVPTPGVRKRLNGIAAAGGHVFAVGIDGTFLHAAPGGGFVAEDRGVSVELTAVAAAGTRVVAVGAGGVVLDGRERKGLADRLLTGVALRGDTVLITSVDGTLFEDYAPVATAPAPLRAVWSDGKAAVAVGAQGTIVTSTPDGWRVVRTGVGPDLAAVAGRGADVWAAGMHGTVLHSRDGGATWEAVKSRTEADLAAVSLIDDDVVVAGERGVVLRSRGGGLFGMANSGTANALLAASGPYLAGAGGTILRVSAAAR